MKFSIRASTHPPVEGQEPNDQLQVFNQLEHPNSVRSWTTSSGLILPLNYTPGGDERCYVTALRPAPDTGEMVPTKVHLTEVLNRLVVDEIKDYLIDTYKCQFIIEYEEGVRFTIREAFDSEGYSEGGKTLTGSEYARSYRVVRSIRLGYDQWVKQDLLLKSNRSWFSMRRELLEEIVRFDVACGITQTEVGQQADPADVVRNMQQDMDGGLQAGAE